MPFGSLLACYPIQEPGLPGTPDFDPVADAARKSLDHRELAHSGSLRKARRIAARPRGMDWADTGAVRMYELSNPSGRQSAALLLLRSAVEESGRLDAPFAIGTLQTSARPYGLRRGGAGRRVSYGERDERS